MSAAVRAFFVDDDWQVANDADESVAVRVVAQGASGRWPLGVWVIDSDRIVVYSTIPEAVRPEYRAAIVDLLGRLNDGMLLGSFELDHRDDRIRFRTSVGVRGVEVTDELLRDLVYPNVATVETYLKILVGCASGAVSHAEAVRAIGTNDTDE